MNNDIENNSVANSIEKYDFDIVEVIKTSFKMTKGFKGIFWAMFFFVALISYLISIMIFPELTEAKNLKEIMQSPAFIQKAIYLSLITMPIGALVVTIFQMTSLSHARGEEVTIKSLNYYTRFILQLTIVAFVVFAMKYILGEVISLGMQWLAVVASVASYMVSISFFFTYMLIADKNISAIESMRLSFYGVKHRFWKVSILFVIFYTPILLVSYIIAGGMMISYPAFGLILLILPIGIVWYYPAILIGTSGLLYRIIFDGVELNSSK